MEIDGGLRKYDAEFYAIIDTRRWRQRYGIRSKRLHHLCHPQ
jgi:hypothetical protein